MSGNADDQGIISDGNDGQPSPDGSAPRTRKTKGPRRMLPPIYAQAAHRIGSGERPTDVAADIGCDVSRLSQLKWGTDQVSRQYQAELKKANDKAIALASTAALARLLRILDAGTDRDAAAAAREVANLQKNLATLSVDLQKLALDRERVDIARTQADAVSNAAASGPTGLVFLPVKADPSI